MDPAARLFPGIRRRKDGVPSLQLLGVAQKDSSKKVANSLVVMSSAAVLAVYTAGYVKTRSAAQHFESQAAQRRPALPGPARTAPATAEFGAPGPHAPAAESSLPAASATHNPPRGSARPTPKAFGNPGSIAPEEHAPTALVVPGAAPSPVPASLPVVEVAPLARQAAERNAPIAEPRIEVPAAMPSAENRPPALALAPPPPPAPVWKDGTYYGWGASRHGNIQVAVVIEGGRIASATIAQCLTRYSCSVIANLPPQVAQRQNAEVDYVSGATQSANAFHYAVLEALSQAK